MMPESSDGYKKYDVTVRLTATSLDEAKMVVTKSLSQKSQRNYEAEVVGVQYLGTTLKSTNALDRRKGRS